MGGENSRFWVTITFMLSAIALCVVMLVTMTIRAHADESMCAPYKELKAALDGHDEHLSGAGAMGGGQAAFALFTSPNGGTWTMVVLGTSGKACIVGVGKNWADLAPAPGEPS